MSSPLKAGLLGYGFAGATFHAPVLAHSGRTTLTAIATGQPERARAAYPQAAIVPDLEALLARDEIDCVVLATPNDTHFALARQVLEAGKHVVVDKPVTLSAAEALALATLAQQRGLLFAPFHNRRWDGDFLTVQDVLASGVLGRLTHFESHFDRFRPLIRPRWREEASRGGGLLFDLGPHLLDQALALFGPPATLSASVKAWRDHAQAPDYLHLQLGYPDFEVLLHASALTALLAPRFTLHGTRGSYLKYGLDTQEDQLKVGLHPGLPGFGEGNLAGRLRVLEGKPGAETEVEREWPTHPGAYVTFYRALAATLQDGAPFPISARDAVDVMSLIELAQRSENEGRRLPFERLV
ncbi:oxidoreductase [Paraburkholderia bonniea]|uniref:oxidoreductase n=1 Tax=Paraburkholderia bonniea TaxID=2152891 RepID=UPI00129100E9|nr:oxidoreductase [Paraburkholderia bonniea]WJF90377.1 oxidoreductase [Paraburkholderia bonniea]WJF93692.1 oxidoreductase [Paraburkholderia bonniea]